MKKGLNITPEIWSLISKNWNYAAQDCNGSINFFHLKPILNEYNGRWDTQYNDLLIKAYCVLNIESNTESWKDTLTKRV